MSKKKKDMAPPNPGWMDKVKDAVAGLAGKVVTSSLDDTDNDFDGGASGGIMPNNMSNNTTLSNPMNFSGSLGPSNVGFGGGLVSGTFGSVKQGAFAIEPPSGVSEKDIPVIDFRFTTIERHPLQDGSEKVWTKMEDPKGSRRFIHKITKANLDRLKQAGKLKMNAFEQVCLPHPADPSLIIFGSDFRDGFVLDDETNLTAYWRIQCKKTGIFLEISNY